MSRRNFYLELVNTKMENSMKGYLFTLIVVGAFAIYPSVAPLGVAEGASPLGFVLSAMVCSFLGITGLAVISGHDVIPARSGIRSRGVLGLIFFLEHVCLLFALNYLAVPVAMCLIYTYPFMIGLAGFVTGEHRSKGLFATLTMCLLGVSLVLGFSVEQLSLAGVSFALAQALLATVRILLTAKLVANEAAIVLTSQMAGIGSIFAAVTAVLFYPEFPQSPLGWIAILSAGLSGMVGHACLAVALKNIRPAPFAVIMNLEPIAAAVLAAIIVGQVLTPMQYLGGLVVVGAVAWYTHSKRELASV